MSKKRFLGKVRLVFVLFFLGWFFSSGISFAENLLKNPIITFKDNTVTITGYSASAPGTLADILSADKQNNWGVISYRAGEDTYKLRANLRIGNGKTETYFQIGTEGHEKEILVTERAIRIEGKASLTTGVKEDKHFSPAIKLDAPKEKNIELLVKGTDAVFNCYNSTITNFIRIAYRNGSRGKIIDSLVEDGGNAVSVEYGARLVTIQGIRTSNCGIKLSSITQDSIHVENCKIEVERAVNAVNAGYSANVVVYDSEIKSGIIVSRKKSHLILESCQLGSVRFQVTENSTILIRHYWLVRVLDKNGNPLSEIKVSVEQKESGNKEELVTNARGECFFKAISKMIDNLGFQKVHNYSYRISLDGKIVKDRWSIDENVTLEYSRKNGVYKEKVLPYEKTHNVIVNNLLKYGDFEICTNKPTDKYPGVPDGWAHYNMAGHHIPGLWFGVDESAAYHGKKSLKVKFPGTYPCDTGESDFHRILSGLSPVIVPGETYTFSIYLKSNREAFPVTFNFGPARKKLTVGTSWKRYVITAAMPANYSTRPIALVRIEIHPGEDERIMGGSLWLDAAQVEQGKIPHPYQPSLNEVVSSAKKKTIPLKDISRKKIPVLKAIKTKNPPQIDGYLNDTCWKESVYIEDFILVDGSGYPTEKTKGYIIYDDNYLYIGMECFDSHMDKLKAEEKQHDGNVWTDDCVEVFLDTNHDHLTYYHFIANALGTQYEEKNPERIGWNGAWEVKTTRNDRSWTAEIAIALKELELLPGREQTWGINLVREQKYKKENSSLSCTFSTAHTPSRFADLKGIDIAVLAEGYKILTQVPKLSTISTEDSYTKKEYKSSVSQGNEVRIGQNGELLVNGEQIFPVGIYHCSWASMCEEGLEDIAQNGFMAVEAPDNWWLEGTTPDIKKITSYLDTAHRHGLSVFLHIMRGLHYKAHKELREQPDLETLKRVISALKDHPALWGWNFAGEPSPKWKERLSSVYQFIKKEDPHHIAWFCNYSPRNIAKFLDVSDVAAFDCYPIPGKGVFQVAEWTDMAMRYANGKRPVWFIPQASYCHEDREPTPAEAHCMAYLSIIHGVKGLMYYYYRPMYEPLWLELGTLNREMKELAPVLFSPDIKQEVSIKPEGSTIHLLQKKYKGKTYLITVNAENATVDISFSIPGLTSSSKIKVLFEERMISAGDGSFTDSFQGFASHVYEINF